MNQKQVWDKTAESWSNFRHWPIKIAKELSQKWKPGKILDIGCGNCRNLLPFKKFNKYGCDFSPEMIKQAKKYTKKQNFKVNLKVANAENLPYKNNFFDYCLSLAVLHHVKNRKKAIQEIHRVLKPEGQAVICVWNKLQLKFLFRKKSIYLKWGKHSRYLYFFSYFELKNLLKKSGFKILKSNFFGKNICFIVTKAI